MSITPGEWGGNLDSPQVSVGHTVYLPVNVPGALLYFGDGHAAQGEGEVAGTGIEVPMHVRLSVDPLAAVVIEAAFIRVHEAIVPSVAGAPRARPQRNGWTSGIIQTSATFVTRSPRPRRGSRAWTSGESRRAVGTPARPRTV